jgi:hypothetical protein
MQYPESTIKKLVIAFIAILIFNAFIFYRLGYHQSNVDTAHKYPILNLKQEVFKGAEFEDGMIYFMGGVSNKHTVYTYQSDSLIFLFTYHPMSGVFLEKELPH